MSFPCLTVNIDPLAVDLDPAPSPSESKTGSHEDLVPRLQELLGQPPNLRPVSRETFEVSTNRVNAGRGHRAGQDLRLDELHRGIAQRKSRVGVTIVARSHPRLDHIQAARHPPTIPAAGFGDETPAWLCGKLDTTTET
jgi:hypothetical protein